MSKFLLNPAQARIVWVRVLRSGNYSKGSFRLRPDGQELDCFGVACELFRRIEGKGYWSLTSKGNHVFLRNVYYLPASVRDWLGLATKEGSFMVDGGKCYTDSLSIINNSIGIEFDHIADIIESEPEGLFDDI